MQATIHESERETVLATDAIPAGRTRPEPARSRRVRFLKWLRRVHGWIGLWGAVLGLLFGVTGILQDHRAVMKIKTGAPSVSRIQVALPDPAPRSPRDLAAYLQAQLQLPHPATKATRDAARAVEWGDRSVMQPEHWSVRFLAPGYLVDADLWQGDAFVTVQRRDQGLIGTIEGLHRAEGASAGWILVADSIGGSMILLALTGLLLWTDLNRRKTIGAAIFVVSALTAIVAATQSL